MNNPDDVTDSPIAHAMTACLFAANRDNEDQNVVDALLQIAEGLQSVARSIRDLGNGNASTNMGAIEALSVVLKDSLSEMSSAIASRE